MPSTPVTADPPLSKQHMELAPVAVAPGCGKRVLVQGDPQRPVPESAPSQLRVQYSLYSDAGVAQSRPLESQALDVVMGTSDLLPAFEAGLRSMTVGERAVLSVAVDAGNGTAPSLHFDTTVKDIAEGVTIGTGVTKYVRKEGDGPRPAYAEGAVEMVVQVTSTATGHSGRLEKHAFTVGGPDSTHLLDTVALAMSAGEMSTVRAASGEELFVVMKNVTRPSAGRLRPNPSGAGYVSDLSAAERLAITAGCRKEGAAMMERGAHLKAASHYKYAIALLAAAPSLEADPAGRTELATLHCNTAIAFRAAEKLTAAMRHAMESTEMDPTRPKPWFVRAQLLAAIREFGEARAALATCRENGGAEADIEQELLKMKRAESDDDAGAPAAAAL